MAVPQLLAPAGSFEHARAAITAGADAVYAGVGQHNLRAQAPNFDPADCTELIRMVHDAGRKVYVVFNAYADERMIAAVQGTLETLARTQAAPDAFIVSDPGILGCCRQVFPNVNLHLSTQAGVFSAETIRFWVSCGVSRVILPRELDLAQIAAFSRAGLCETEVFIHGAMCVAIAGRCLLGQYRNGRNANQGDCPQPCRVQYRISDVEADGVEWDVEETPEGVHLLNARDLCSLPILDKVVATGTASLKIEGRNKSVHYVTSVVSVYRQALDRIAQGGIPYSVDPLWQRELDLLDHRPYTTGFYGTDTNLQSQHRGKEPSHIRVVALVREILPDGRVVADVRNPFETGESLSLLNPGRPPVEPYVVPSGLTDLAGNPVHRAVTNRLVVFPADCGCKPGDLLRRIV